MMKSFRPLLYEIYRIFFAVGLISAMSGFGEGTRYKAYFPIQNQKVIMSKNDQDKKTEVKTLKNASPKFISNAGVDLQDLYGAVLIDDIVSASNSSPSCLLPYNQKIEAEEIEKNFYGPRIFLPSTERMRAKKVKNRNVLVMVTGAQVASAKEVQKPKDPVAESATDAKVAKPESHPDEVRDAIAALSSIPKRKDGLTSRPTVARRHSDSAQESDNNSSGESSTKNLPTISKQSDSTQNDSKIPESNTSKGPQTQIPPSSDLILAPQSSANTSLQQSSQSTTAASQSTSSTSQSAPPATSSIAPSTSITTPASTTTSSPTITVSAEKVNVSDSALPQLPTSVNQPSQESSIKQDDASDNKDRLSSISPNKVESNDIKQDTKQFSAIYKDEAKNKIEYQIWDKQVSKAREDSTRTKNLKDEKISPIIADLNSLDLKSDQKSKDLFIIDDTKNKIGDIVKASTQNNSQKIDFGGKIIIERERISGVEKKK